MTKEKVKGFSSFFYKVVKANYSKLTFVKQHFSEKKKKDEPFYYLEVILKLQNQYVQKQLLVALMICFNHFSIVPKNGTTGSPEWNNFFNSYHSSIQQPDQRQER